MNPRITQVKPLDDFLLLLEFTNQQKKIFDVKPYLHYTIYHELNDVAFFNKAKVMHGTVVWNDSIDFCPDTLFLESA